MEAEGAAGDQPDDVVEAFGAAVVDAEFQRGQDAVAVLANRSGDGDEGVDARAGGFADPAVDQLGRVIRVEVAGEDRAEGLLEVVGPPDGAAAAAQFAPGGLVLLGIGGLGP